MTVKPAVEQGSQLGSGRELGVARSLSVLTTPVWQSTAVMAAVERNTARMLPVTRG